MNRFGKIRLITFSILSLTSLAIAIQLTRIHYLTHTDPSYESLCAVSEKINCETVALSPYAIWFGVPVSVWGTISYLVFLLLTISGFFRERFHNQWPAGLFCGLSLFSVLISAYLAYISVFKIDSICLLCSTLYVINITLLGLSLCWLFGEKISAWHALKKDFVALVLQRQIAIPAALLGVTVVSGIVLFWPKYWKTGQGRPSRALSEGITENGDYWIGSTSPHITILEFTDYECPFCRRAHQTIRKVLFENPCRIRLVHKHFPLDPTCNKSVTRPFHLRACEFSQFVACAGQQGQFWNANDAIFSGLDAKPASKLDLNRIAIRLGLDLSLLRSCISTEKIRSAISCDVEEAITHRIRGTPSYLIGKTIFEGMIPPKTIENQLQALDKSE